GDRQLDYQFLTSPNFNSFNAHSVSFTQPLPWRHLLTFFGSYANIKGSLPPPLDMKGYNWQTSARYEIPLPGTPDFKEALTLGLDYKKTDNNLTFGGLSVFVTAIEIAQGNLSYNSRLKDALGESSARATLNYSPGGLGTRNNNDAFREARADSRANYTYGKLELNRSTKLPYDFLLVNLLTFQLADANLQASEQLGFGGYDTIRGYDTRVFNSDNGFIVSTELRTPSMKAFCAVVPALEKLGDQWQLLAFTDFGDGSNHLRLPGEPADVKLWSAGPGLRYTISTHVTARADYGWQLLNQAEAARPYASRSHVSLIVRY